MVCETGFSRKYFENMLDFENIVFATFSFQDLGNT